MPTDRRILNAKHFKLFGILHTKSTNSTEIHFQRTNGVCVCAGLPLHIWHSEIFYPIFNLLAFYFRPYLTINYRFIAHSVDPFVQKFINDVVVVVVDFSFDGVQIKCLTFDTFAIRLFCT